MRLVENPRYAAQLRGVGKPAFLAGKTVMITGAAGMLGSCLADVLMYWNRVDNLRCRVVALGRSMEGLEDRFPGYFGSKDFQALRQDVCEPVRRFSQRVDYVVHAASNADPASMLKDPVGTLLANVTGTKHMVEYGLAHGMKRFLYVSSGEVYGQAKQGQDSFKEDDCGTLSLNRPRSCYPEGKRAAEVFCQCCASQYGADVAIVRPCHLFGPTMKRKDSRAAAEFLWAAAQGQDVPLKSGGLRERSHSYVVDAVAAVLLVLERGVPGNAYNIADKRYEMTVREFAERTAWAGGSRVNRLAKDDPPTESGRQVLCTEKLEGLGWSPASLGYNAIYETVNILREAIAHDG